MLVCVACFLGVSIKFGVGGYWWVMKWQYKVSLFLLVLSQVVFFGVVAYYTDDQFYYPDGNMEAPPTRGYSWIWYHAEQWIVSLVLAVAAVAFFVIGFGVEIRESSWRGL